MSILVLPLSFFEEQLQILILLLSWIRQKSSKMVSIHMAREKGRGMLLRELLQLNIGYITCLNFQGLKSMLCCIEFCR